MRSYVRESVKLGNGRTLITHYTTSEYFWMSALKFIFFLTILWPFEILIWLVWMLLKWSSIGLWMITKWSFIGIGKALGALFKWIFHRH